MRRLPPESIHALHKAALAVGLERESLLAGIDNVLVAHIDLARSPSEQILRDLHQLNEIPSGEGGADPLEQWLRNAHTLSAARSEAKLFELHLAKLEPAAAAGRTRPIGSAVPSLSLSSGGAGPRWTGTLQQRARVEAALSAVPAREHTQREIVCPSCGYDGVMIARIGAAKKAGFWSAAGATLLVAFFVLALQRLGVPVKEPGPAREGVGVLGLTVVGAAYIAGRYIFGPRIGRRVACPFCEHEITPEPAARRDHTPS